MGLMLDGATTINLYTAIIDQLNMNCSSFEYHNFYMTFLKLYLI